MYLGCDNKYKISVNAIKFFPVILQMPVSTAKALPVKSN